MTDSRELFLQRVRQAVAAGNRAGVPAALEPRGSVEYRGAGPDAVSRFCDELAKAGGQAYLVPDRDAAAMRVLELVKARSARRILIGGGKLLDQLNLRASLQELAAEVISADGLEAGSSRDVLFSADLGITGVDYLVAETGSLVLLMRPGEPRTLSLLPPVHIAVAEQAQIVPDLFDVFAALGTSLTLPSPWGRGQGEGPVDGPALPSCLTLITGPSKTGDIELRLVTGVHGPGELHVILLT